MPAYSFQKQFVDPVERGDKTHTIRGKRKSLPKAGHRFVGYYAMRTKQCRKLIDSTITRVQDICIETSERICEYRGGEHYFYAYPRITIDGEILARDEMEALARRDGFPDLFTMMSFWPDEKRPFDGDLIHWKFPAEKPTTQPISG
jgi:hypothetical protein